MVAQVKVMLHNSENSLHSSATEAKMSSYSFIPPFIHSFFLLSSSLLPFLPHTFPLLISMRAFRY